MKKIIVVLGLVLLSGCGLAPSKNCARLTASCDDPNITIRIPSKAQRDRGIPGTFLFLINGVIAYVDSSGNLYLDAEGSDGFRYEALVCQTANQLPPYNRFNGCPLLPLDKDIPAKREFRLATGNFPHGKGFVTMFCWPGAYDPRSKPNSNRGSGFPVLEIQGVYLEARKITYARVDQWMEAAPIDSRDPSANNHRPGDFGANYNTARFNTVIGLDCNQ